MANQIPVHIARERNRVLRDLAAEKKLAFMRSFISRELQAITLNVTGQDVNGPWTEALTDNYLKMKLRGKWESNRWLTTRVTAVQNGELLASVAGFDDVPLEDETSSMHTGTVVRNSHQPRSSEGIQPRA